MPHFTTSRSVGKSMSHRIWSNHGNAQVLVLLRRRPMCYNRPGSLVGSVTGLVHRYTPAFDADSAIMSMMRSRRWPRPGYLVRRL